MITLIFSGIILIFAGIFAYSFIVAKEIITKNVETSARHLTSETVNKLNGVLSSVEKVSYNFIFFVQHNSFTRDQINESVKMIVEHNPEIYGAALAYDPGQIKGIVASVPYFYKSGKEVKTKMLGSETVDYTHLDWYQIPFELKQNLWSEPYFDKEGCGIVTSTFSAPVFREVKGTKEFIGILKLDISLDWLQDIVASIKVSKTGYGFVISRSGKLVTHPIKDVIMNETIFSISEDRNIPSLRDIGRRMIHGATGFEKADYRSLYGENISWISYAPLPQNGWSLGIIFPIKELLADVNNLFWIVTVLVGFGGVLILLVIVFIADRITGSLRKLADITRDMAKGNFDVEIPSTQDKDEIGELTESFIAMQSALNDTIHKLQDANFELEDYNLTLEEKVETRTAELKVKNIQLDSAYNNVKTLSEIGQKLTSSLNIELIFTTIYESINSLMDATVFVIMIYNEKKNLLDVKMCMENGERMPFYSYDMNDKNRFAVWCIDNKAPIFMNDVDAEWHNYISHRTPPKAGNYAASLIYIPLIVEGRIFGAISTQSYQKNAYNQVHFDIVQNIASYAAVAMDNAFAYEKINNAMLELKAAQLQLVQSEKMASLGQLTAGIAHEIKNPLNFINNFAELCIELTSELRGEFEKSFKDMTAKDRDYFLGILDDLSDNAKKINEHGKRADSIVKGMLLHSRGKAGDFQKTDINALLLEYVNLAYHGFRAQDSTFNIKIENDFDSSLLPFEVVPQDISRVFLNIINNACYSVHEKKKERKDGYSPVLSTKTHDMGDKVKIVIRDNGKGIPKEIQDKIFNPFFTTKPTGKGTGLGLSLSFDIVVQVHKGELQLCSEEGEFAEFTIILPKNPREK